MFNNVGGTTVNRSCLLKASVCYQDMEVGSDEKVEGVVQRVHLVQIDAVSAELGERD